MNIPYQVYYDPQTKTFSETRKHDHDVIFINYIDYDIIHSQSISQQNRIAADHVTINDYKLAFKTCCRVIDKIKNINLANINVKDLAEYLLELQKLNNQIASIAEYE